MPGDYEGDGITDIAVFRPSTGEWFVLRSSSLTLLTLVWGGRTDIPAQGDYDGDCTIEVTLVWGGGADIPVPADFDGDSKADVAIFRPSTGEWFIRQSTTLTMVRLVWGGGSDIPVFKRP